MPNMDSKTLRPLKKSDVRRASLIDATLKVIARDGVRSTTVRSISREANVTQGLIRYYFQSKDELIAEAYRVYMQRLIDEADEAASVRGDAKSRLVKFLEVSLQAPVTSRSSVSTWAGFFELLLHDETMIESHKHSYNQLRLKVKSLIADIFIEEGSPRSDSELRRLSIAGNAILDGLWMEGGAIPETFHPGELARVGVDSFSGIIGIDLQPSRS